LATVEASARRRTAVAVPNQRLAISILTGIGGAPA
jgi:hypothetical protein